MISLPDKLPDDPEQLRALLVALADDAKKQEQGFKTEVKRLNNHLAAALESLRLERVRRYGSNSEKNPDQAEMFDEAEADSAENLADSNVEKSSTASPSKKTPSGRKPLPDNLERIRTVHELSLEQRQCPCGSTLEEIGETISEQLDIKPATVKVIQHVRKKYACKSCEDTVKSAAKPALLLPKSIASANTMAYVITAKYADGLPLYRLSHILKRYDVELARQTLSESVLTTAKKIEPLIEHLEQQLLSSALLYMDETRVQVLNEPDKSAQSQSYMWVRRGGPPETPIVHFHYDPGRSTAVAETLLSGFSGTLMSDGYRPYRNVSQTLALVHLCCWSHVRRKFVEAKKAQVKGQSGKADEAIAFIAKLYAVEKRMAESDAATRHRTRQDTSASILTEFRKWLLDQQSKVAPKRKLGRAISYALEYWPELVRYVDNGTWPIDNNLAENAIRPFVVGRKAWMFSSSVRGARASANLYSLIETAKASNCEPYRYLCWLLNKLPTTPTDQIHTLAPWNMPVQVK